MRQIALVYRCKEAIVVQTGPVIPVAVMWRVRIVCVVRTLSAAVWPGTKAVLASPHLYVWRNVIAKRLHPLIVVRKPTVLQGAETLHAKRVFAMQTPLAVPCSGMRRA